jgi:hypothetical protein
MAFMSQVASKKKRQLHLMNFLHWLCPKEWTSSTSSSGGLARDEQRTKQIIERKTPQIEQC